MFFHVGGEVHEQCLQVSEEVKPMVAYQKNYYIGSNQVADLQD